MNPMINNDVKIIAKVLARRLEKRLPTFVPLDQNGFIKRKTRLSQYS